jgi:hypothetical protein
MGTILPKQITMKTKMYPLIVIVCLMCSQLKAQVPNAEIEIGCARSESTGPIVTIGCANCCEYNATATENNAITHKCKTPTNQYCTGEFINGRCPDCYFIVHVERSNQYPFLHAIIYVPTLNKKWIFDPNAPSTSHSSNSFEGLIHFTPLDGNMNGSDLTTEDFNLINSINP